MNNSTTDAVDYDVIIVGGGLAGISSARHLLKRGLKRILVLEAQNYTGGRIKTIDTESGPLELGAEWIHGQNGNPLFELAVEHDMIYSGRQNSYISPSSVSIYNDHEFRTEAGELINKEIVCDVTKTIDNIFDKVMDAVPREYGNTGIEITTEEPRRMTTRSRAEYFSDEFGAYLQNSKHEGVDEKSIQCLYRWRLKWEIGENAFISLQDVAYPGRYLMYEGPGLSYLKYGYKSILTILQRDVPDHCIRLCSPVKQIKWGPNSCLVEGLDGSVSASNHVIITVSIGYLQKNMDTLFAPPVPQRKETAVSNLGFSTLLKVFLIWNKPFWKEQFKGVQFAWRKSSIQEMDTKEIDFTKSEEKRKII